MPGDLVKISAEGTLVHIPIETKEPTLKQLQDAVGGYVRPITIVYLENKQRQMYVDEDGLLKGLKPNRIASKIADQLLVGDVCIWVPGVESAAPTVNSAPIDHMTIFHERFGIAAVRMLIAQAFMEAECGDPDRKPTITHMRVSKYFHISTFEKLDGPTEEYAIQIDAPSHWMAAFKEALKTIGDLTLKEREGRATHLPNENGSRTYSRG